MRTGVTVSERRASKDRTSYIIVTIVALALTGLILLALWHSTSRGSEVGREYVDDTPRCGRCGAKIGIMGGVDPNDPRNNVCGDCVQRAAGQHEAMARLRHLQE
jgi:hypothetical protein